MFAFIRGKLAYSNVESVIVDVQGVGYKIFIPLNALSLLPALQEEITLHTSYVIREFSQALYGFLTTECRDWFEILIAVNGVGPKTALALLGTLSLPDFNQAISTNNDELLRKVPGIGKKTAERLLLEMRDRCLQTTTKSKALAPALVAFAATPEMQVKNDALSALMNLGFSRPIAEKNIAQCMKKLPESVDLSTLITEALKHV